MPPRKHKAPPLSEYELLRLANIRRNNAFLAAQGLGEIKKSLAPPPKPKRAPSVKRKRSPRKSGPQRRSTRQRGEPARYDPGTLDNLPQFAQRRKPSGGGTKRGILAAPLSKGQLAVLGKAKCWLGDFEDFLLSVPHGRNEKTVSEANASRAMRQVRLLVSGQAPPRLKLNERLSVICGSQTKSS